MKNSREGPRILRYLYRLRGGNGIGFGHILRKGHDIIEREVLDWNPQGQRKRGRPKQTWRRSVHYEALGEGKSWGEVKQLARNRIRWRRFVDALGP